jgi:hypothetical protein
MRRRKGLQTTGVSLRQFIATFLSCFVLTSCSNDKDTNDKRGPKPQEIFSSTAVSEDHTLLITDFSGNPIIGAQVLVGPMIGQPVPGNFATTDRDGKVRMPQDWTGPQPVTVEAEGFLRTTYLKQWPNGQRFTLRKKESSLRIELAGVTTGHSVVDRDNKIDFALVLPAFKKQDLFAFDPNKFISLETDPMSIVGRQVNVPSNVSLPRQTEWMFLPIRLDKLRYRMYFSSLGSQTVYALKGQMPFREVIQHVQQQKPLFELINFFDLQSGSIQSVPLFAETNSADLAVNEIAFSQQISVAVPPKKEGEVIIAAAALNRQGLFFPTDVKLVQSGASVNLKTINTDQTSVLYVLAREADLQTGKNPGRISAAMDSLKTDSRPALLDLMEVPTGDLKSVKITPIKSRQGLAPWASYLMLSKVGFVPSPGDAPPRRVLERVWEVYGEGWIDGLQVPQFPGDRNEKSSVYRWEVSLLGHSSSQKVELGPKVLDTSTHATSAGFDF